MKSPLIGALILFVLTLFAAPYIPAQEEPAGKKEESSGEEQTDTAEHPGLTWETDISAAMKKAKTEGKDIMINFTGSDWCSWCKKLDSEVFSKPGFDESAGKQFIYLFLDFPQAEELKAKVVSPELNDKHRDEMSVSGYPTIILADAEMRPYGRTGYLPGGPEAYLKNLTELRTDGEKLKKLLSSKDEEASTMLSDVFGVMTKNELLGYPGYSKYLEMAEKSENEELKKLVASHKASMRLRELLNTSEPNYPTLVAFLSENPGISGPDTLNALWFCQQWLTEQDRKPEARKFLERMLADPLVAENPQGKKMIEQAIINLDHSEGNHDHDGDGVPDH